jgi:lipopolysaccharide export LptBFGC system permease protein LptF
MVVLYKKYSVPVSAFILTIIAVSVSYKKRRGGMGMNLTIGIAIAFGYVFLIKYLVRWLKNLLFTIVGSMVPILFSEY